MRAYYNEKDPYAAQWLRNLEKAGHIAAGDVDERPIEAVSADDLRGYTQCHFFAGVGGWSLALRLAGWPAARPVWTGSCPCQPFSKAGSQKGFADDRHLWPTWCALISECRPPTIFGEQVAGAWLWLDAVFSDLENHHYACAAASMPAASVGAPHIRERLWFVAANAEGERRGTRLRQTETERDWRLPRHGFGWPPAPDVPRVGDGLPGAVAKRRAFGNAIVPQVAAHFIAAFAEIDP